MNRTQRFWLFTSLDLFFALVMPVIFITIQYDLFTNDPNRSSVSISGWGVVAILLIALGISKRAKDYVTASKNSQLKYFVANTTPPFILLFLYFILTMTENHIDRLQFITLWSSMSNLIALLFRFLAGREI
jgi:hypothetical protein